MIFLSALLLAALCSCRSSRQSEAEYAQMTSVGIEKAGSSLTVDDVRSLITSSLALDLSGITVEFFPPDSTRPDAVGAPKAINIANAKAKASAARDTHRHTTADEQEAESLSAQSSASASENTREVDDILRPSARLILGAIMMVFIIIFIKSRK